MKNQDNNPPKFLCDRWVKEQGNLPKFKSEECKQQCHACMDKVIDHHFNKGKDNDNGSKTI